VVSGKRWQMLNGLQSLIIIDFDKRSAAEQKGAKTARKN
jgi:hypothetical protein